MKLDPKRYDVAIKQISKELSEKDVVIKSQTKIIKETQEDVGKFKILVANEIQAVVGEFEIVKADIGAFQTVVTENLNAQNIKVGTIEGDLANFKAITANEIAAINGSFNSLDVKYATIDLANVKAGSITQAMIGEGVVGTAQIADGSITDAKIVGLTANKITAGKLDAGVIEVVNLNAANITVGTINGQQIAPGAIDASKLTTDLNTTISSAASNAAQAISNATKAQLTADGKNAAFYQSSAPSTADRKLNDIWFDTDDGNKMYYWNGSAWTAQQFSTSALAASAITAEKIAASAITAAKIAAGTITATQIASNTITAGNIATGAITAGKIAANAVAADNIAANAITSDKIVAAAITTDKLAANAITANKILAGAITTDKLDANAVTAIKIAAGAITTDKLAANAVTANKIDVNDLFAQSITATGSITGAKLYGTHIEAVSGKIGGFALTNNILSAEVSGVYISPGYTEVVKILQYSSEAIELTDQELAASDLDGDGLVLANDATLALQAITGQNNYSDYAGAKTSTAKVKIDPTNPNKAVHIFGTNAWGREIESYLGIDGLKVDCVTAERINLKGIVFMGDVCLNETGLCDTSNVLDPETIFGINDNQCISGNTDYSLNMFGSGTRPTYNGTALALFSDVSGSGNIDLSDYALASHNHDGTYLSLSGGTMTGPLVLTGGDAASGVGNMQLDTNGQITAKGTTATLFGKTSGSSNLLVGHSSHALLLRGSATRPTYNGGNLALYSDLNGYLTTSGTAAKATADGSGNNIVNTYATKTELAKKANDFTVELYNGNAGNPKPVKFATVNYSTCDSNNGVSAKISMVSGHGNGVSYVFLQDVIINVGYSGTVTVDNFKYFGAETPTYDSAVRQYGDVFYVVDTTNKIVDFYCLMGQYARVYQTPWKRLTYSSGGTLTQHTSCTVYSSGTKAWANNSNIALVSDIPSGGTVSGDYLPLSGGLMTGSIKFQTSSLPQKALEYVCGIDAFASGGEMGWQSKADFLAGYATTAQLGSYLPLSGGALTGALTFANGTMNTVGDDVQIGDQNVAGTLCVKGTNGTTAIQFMPYNSNAVTATLMSNDVSTYGGLRVTGLKGNYHGILLGDNNTGLHVMSCEPHQGLYNESTGQWLLYYNRTYNQISMGGAATNQTGYKLDVYGATRIQGALDATGSISEGGTALSSKYAQIATANTYNGEQKFQNSSYCPTVTDTASGVGCAFKASRGMTNELLVDKLIMTASTGKIPFYKYTGTSGGSMTGLTEVASISSAGALTITGGGKISGRYQNGGDDEGLVIGRASNNYAGLCLGEPSGVRSVFYLLPSNSAVWRYNNGSSSYDIQHPGKSGTIALISDITDAGLGDGSLYLPCAGGTISGGLTVEGTAKFNYMLWVGSSFAVWDQGSICHCANFSIPLTTDANRIYPALERGSSDELIVGEDEHNTNVYNLVAVNNRITCAPTYNNTVSSATNVYVNSSGVFTRTTTTSSRTIKHDIESLINEDIKAENLYNIEVVQFKYNDNIITDMEDARYGKTLPGFIIEDMNNVYPIAVDKPGVDEKEWSWNAQYMIPPMLKLIQDQHKEDIRLDSKIDNVRAELISTQTKLDAAMMKIAELENEIDELKAA